MLGLLLRTERKNGGLAEQAGEATPDGMQRLLCHAAWGYAADHPGHEQALEVAVAYLRHQGCHACMVADPGAISQVTSLNLCVGAGAGNAFCVATFLGCRPNAVPSASLCLVPRRTIVAATVC
nr:hypothetical protein [Actinoalloteichus spitiensis]